MALLAPVGAPQPTPHSTGKLFLAVIGGLVVALAVALLAIATLLHSLNGKRDDEGYYSIGTVRLTAKTYAITNDIDVHRGLLSMLLGKDSFHDVRIQARSARPVFLGVAERYKVTEYLGDSAYTRISDFDVSPFRPIYVVSAATSRPRTRALSASGR